MARAVWLFNGRSHTAASFSFFAAKRKARQLENKAGTKGAKCGGNVWEIRWPGCSAADNETCATFRRHSRRQGTKYAVKYGIKRRNNTSKKWGKEGGTMHDKSRHM